MMENPCLFCGNEKTEKWDKYTKYHKCDCPDAVKSRTIQGEIQELLRQAPKTKFRVENKQVMVMRIDWLIDNAKAGRGFIAQRVKILTYSAICQLFGTAIILNHGSTDAGIPIGQVLTPKDFDRG